jgi:hypothetical protein
MSEHEPINDMTKINLTINRIYLLIVSFLSLQAIIVYPSTADSSQVIFEDAVKQAVTRQINDYPYSTLKDLYKNFFQDRFGPGHLIEDTVAAGQYLRGELASFDHSDGAVCEPTGWEGCFLRVNLSVVKEHLVPFNVFFDAFVRSVNQITPLSVEQWQTEWISIDSIISSMNLSLADYEKDRKMILDMLDQGETVMHHSTQFEQHYSPHYRIIKKTVFERDIQPYLAENVYDTNKVNK